MKNLDNFRDAFNPGFGSYYGQCACGREFYNPTGDWDVEESEWKLLEEDKEATALDWSVGHVEFEGTLYISDCDCWHKRAQAIMNFIDSHDSSIVAYLKKEKARKMAEANKLDLDI